MASLHAVVDELFAVDPIYLDTGEKQDVLIGVSRAKARLAALEMRVLAVADDIAVETGARSTAAWLADETRDAHESVRRGAQLGSAMAERWQAVRDALAEGSVNVAQTHAIVDALDSLPGDLDDALKIKAEAHLLGEAATFGPRELRNLGRGLLEVIAPDIADQVDYQRLLAEEARASAATRLTIRKRGDGSTDINARVPDHAAGRLAAYLNAYTAPRRRHLHDTVETPFGPVDPVADDEVAQLPLTRRRGDAFVALLENIPTTALPRHGGTATAVMVTLDYDTLVSGIGVATTSTGNRITADQARRLACQAAIIPIVLGAKSEILDQGRAKRCFTEPQRKAMNLRDETCTTLGCTMPAAFCEAHHIVPWSRGGKTDLKDGKLLCSFHHHRAHDPAWQVHHHRNGKTTFNRRT